MTRVPLECWALATGVALDALLGDPRGWPHPVRAIGWLIARTENLLRAGLRATGLGPRGAYDRAAGLMLLPVVTGLTGASVAVLVYFSARAGVGVSFVVQSVLIFWGLAARSLAVETLKASEEPDLTRARSELAMIVGRDTGSLDRREICRACVETVAENGNDAVIAPLFWFAVGGVVGLWVYKAVNTLDSMVGYRDDRYLRLGWASARFDDLLGLAPARLTWLIMSLAAALVGENGRRAFRVGWRDGRKHPSPNAAWGEATMAGALGVQLGGETTYRGVRRDKPRLGDPGESLGPGAVRRSIRVMTIASLLAATLAGLARFWLQVRA